MEKVINNVIINEEQLKEAIEQFNLQDLVKILPPVNYKDQTKKQ